MSSEKLKIEVSFEDEAPQDVFAALKEVGATDVKELKQRGITGVDFVILGVLVVSAVSRLAIKLIRMWKCGVIVDTRGSKVVVEKNCDLPRGSVLVIKADGTEATLQEVAEEDLEKLIGKLGSMNS